jgi:hypothetical protein
MTLGFDADFTGLSLHDVYFSPSTGSIRARGATAAAAGGQGAAFGFVTERLFEPVSVGVEAGAELGELTNDEIELIYDSLLARFAPADLPDLAIAEDGSILLRLATEWEDEGHAEIADAVCTVPLVVWGRQGGSVISGGVSAPFVGDDALTLANETSPDSLDLLERGEDGVWIYSLPSSFHPNDDVSPESSTSMPKVCLSHGLGCFHLARWPNADPWTPFPVKPTCATTTATNCTPDRFLDMVSVEANSLSFALCPRDTADASIIAAAPGQFSAWSTDKHDAVRACGTFVDDQFRVINRVTGLSSVLDTCLKVSTNDATDKAYARAGKGRIYLEGLRAFFDSPGEFYVDWSTRRLHLFVGPDVSALGHPELRSAVWDDRERAAAVRILVATETEPVVDLFRSSNIHILDVTFDGNRGSLVRLRESSDVTLRHVTARASSHDALVVQDSTNVRIEDSLVEWCDSTGIVFDSGDVPSNSFAETVLARTLVRRVGLVATNRGAITLAGVGATVLNCTVSESPAAGLEIRGGQSHRVAGVRFDRLASYASSVGAVFAAGSWITTNITLGHLYFSRIDNRRALETSTGATPVGILHLANAASGVTFRSTLASHLPPALSTTMSIDAGRDLHIHDNLFLSTSLSQLHQGTALVKALPLIESGDLDVMADLTYVDHRAEPWLSDFPRVSEFPATLDAIKSAGMVKPRYSRIHHNFRLGVTRGNESWLFPSLGDGRSFASLAQDTSKNEELVDLAVDSVFVVDEERQEVTEVKPVADWLPEGSGPIVAVDLRRVGVPAGDCIGAEEYRVATKCVWGGEDDDEMDMGEYGNSTNTTMPTETPSSSGTGEGDDGATKADASSDEGGSGAVVGAVVGTSLVLLLAAVAFMVVRRRRARESSAALAVGPTMRPGVVEMKPRPAPIPVRLPVEETTTTTTSPPPEAPTDHYADWSAADSPIIATTSSMTMTTMASTSRSRARSRAKSTSASTTSSAPTDHYASIGPPKRAGDTINGAPMGNTYGGLTLTALDGPPPPPPGAVAADGDYGVLQVAPATYAPGPPVNQAQMM